MRVLLDVSAVPDHPVGAGVYTINLAAELAGSGDVELHLAARAGDARRWGERCPGATCHAVVPARRPARLAWEQTGAGKLARRVAPDVWHGPHYTMPLSLEVPAVVTVHDLTFFDHPEWHERVKVTFFRRMIRASTRRAAALIADSDRTARRLEELLHPRAPVTVAPLGVDHGRFHPDSGPAGAAEDRAVLRRLGIEGPYLAFTGTAEPRKGIPTLVEAFATLAGSRPELRLVLAGRDGWGAAAVRDAIERHGVSTRVLRTGWFPADALPALLRRAEAVVYPSLEEGFGLPALEALAAGAVLVTSSDSVMADLAGPAAVTVPAGDPAALSNALAAVLDDPDRSAPRRAAGVARARGFTWRACAERHLAAYRQAAECPRGRAPYEGRTTR